MQEAESKVWDQFPKVSSLPCIPLVTLNWDARPWVSGNNYYSKTPYFSGYSEQSVFKSVKQSISWLKAHPLATTKEKLILLYAWNEYGEGAWLTPGGRNKNGLLNGVKQAIKLSK